MDLAKKSKNIETVLLDLDGTIFERNNYTRIQEIINLYRLFINEHFDIQFNDFQENLKSFWSSLDYYGSNEVVSEEAISSVFHNTFMLEPGTIQASRLLDLLYEADETSVIDGVQEVLEELYSRGYKIIAITNWFRKYQIKRLKQFDLFKYFEQVFGWDNTQTKPHKLACGYYKHTSGDFDGSIMIGDSIINDIGYANNIGIPSILVNKGVLERDLLKKYTPTYLITDVEGILSIL